MVTVPVGALDTALYYRACFHSAVYEAAELGCRASSSIFCAQGRGRVTGLVLSSVTLQA